MNQLSCGQDGWYDYFLQYTITIPWYCGLLFLFSDGEIYRSPLPIFQVMWERIAKMLERYLGAPIFLLQISTI